MSPTPPARAPVRVVPAAEADCAALADIYRLSFLPHALGQAMFSRADPVLVAAKLGDRFRALLASPRHAVCKAVRPGVGNAVLGFAWWELPRPVGVADGGAEEEDEEVKREWAPGTDVELVTALFADLGAHASRIEGPHLKLHMLGTDPQHQRTGTGSALVRWGMARAEAERVALFLDATDEGIPLYEHLGFVRWGEPIWLRNGSCALYPMVYRPTEL